MTDKRYNQYACLIGRLITSMWLESKKIASASVITDLISVKRFNRLILLIDKVELKISDSLGKMVITRQSLPDTLIHM